MNGTCLEFQNPIEDAISRLRFASESNTLLISSWDSKLRLYDVDRSTLRVEVPSEAGLLDCCFQNDVVAFSAGSDCCIRRYDLDSGVQETFGGHSDLVSCIEYSDNTSQLISAGWDKKLLFWDTHSKSSVGCLDTREAEVESMSIYDFNLIVAIGSSVKVYDLRYMNESAYVKELCIGGQIRCVRPILNKSLGFVVGSIDGRVAVEYLNSNDDGYVFWSQPKSKKDVNEHRMVAVNDIVFSPSMSSVFITGNEMGYVTAWDVRNKRRLHQFSQYSNSVESLSFNCGGEMLAVACSYSYRAKDETEEVPQIFIHEMTDLFARSSSARSSKSDRKEEKFC